ncbi:Predicted oxidoreductase [Streptacidiphilus jiangxiensis]|uniref:Predicted oxidoreductase n=2 Tax=Streptacidiphilus jiangxiensis TaxID=235985 RepID=A0A1H8B189_STRJI|nr:aldo/keto reductase [Streptacidiphilus jiangxiensis]SEM76731.1 Predicted oxidoreductase [Streptacidiphilus jiangxiensis]
MSLQVTPRLLATGLAVHPLGVGCRAIGDTPRGHAVTSDRQWLDGMRRAVERGATLFDTADTYGDGHAERLLGKVLRESRRQGLNLQVSSKIGHRGSAPHPYAGPHMKHQLEQSLDNLGVDRIDLYVLPTFDFGDNDRYLGGAIQQMRTLQELGYIGAVGLRGPHAEQAGDGGTSGRFLQLFRLIEPDVVLADFNALTPLIDLDEDEDLFAFAARHGTGVLITTPFAGGFLTGRPDRAPSAPRSKGGEILHRLMDPLRQRLGDRPGLLAMAALRYCLSRGPHTAVLAGFGTPDHVATNFDCLDLALDAEDLDLIAGIYAQLRCELAVRTGEATVGAPV